LSEQLNPGHGVDASIAFASFSELTVNQCHGLREHDTRATAALPALPGGLQRSLGLGDVSIVSVAGVRSFPCLWHLSYHGWQVQGMETNDCEAFRCLYIRYYESRQVESNVTQLMREAY